MKCVCIIRVCFIFLGFPNSYLLNPDLRFHKRGNVHIKLLIRIPDYDNIRDRNTMV
jgi:hypothetical protein